MIEHFSRVIEGTEQSIMSAKRGLRIVRILEASQKVLDETIARGRETRAQLAGGGK